MFRRNCPESEVSRLFLDPVPKCLVAKVSGNHHSSGADRIFIFCRLRSCSTERVAIFGVRTARLSSVLLQVVDAGH